GMTREVRAAPVAASFPVAGRAAAAARALLWLAILTLVVYPLLIVLAGAFAPALIGDEPLQISELLTGRLFTASLNTIRLGVAVSLLSLLFGTAAAVLAAGNPRGRYIDWLMSIPFLTPPFLVSLAWSLAVGPRGYLARFGLPGEFFEHAIFSFAGMAALMAAHYAPAVYFAVRAQIARLPPSLLWAAHISGASAEQSLKRILLPLIAPALLAGGFLAFAAGIEEYGTPLVIGNRIGFPVIATEIGRLVAVYPIRLTLASALRSTLLAAAGGAYWLSYLLQRHSVAYAKTSAYPAPALLPAKLRAALCCFVVFYAGFAIVVPFGSMLLTSLLKLVSVGPAASNLTLAHYARALTADAGGLRDALTASFTLAVSAAVA